jgi:8-oxo-dGTP diphosphatase
MNALLGLSYRSALLVRDAWVWMRRPQTVGVRVLVVRAGARGDEVLLVRHRAGVTPWDLPGGGVAHGEPVAVAARREVFEEAGVRVQVEGVYAVFDNFRRWRSDTVLVLVARPFDEPQPPRRSLEIAEARFFALDSLPPTLNPGARRCILSWQRGERGMFGNWWE